MLIPDGGVQKKLIKQGEDGRTAQPGDTIIAHFIGKLTDGTVFDASQDKGGPVEIELGLGNVMPGWEIALQSMTLGEVAGIVIHPDYGFGSQANSKVPADSTLLFLFQLIEINEPVQEVEEAPQQEMQEDFGIEILTQDQGVLKKKFVAGEEGRSPAPEDIVVVHYEGRLLHDGTLFDSSYERGEPIAFPIGVGAVIQGWEIGIMSMTVGEKSQIVVTSDYGYGDEGSGPIPGGATMIFNVEFLDMWTPEPEET